MLQNDSCSVHLRGANGLPLSALRSWNVSVIGRLAQLEVQRRPPRRWRAKRCVELVPQEHKNPKILAAHLGGFTGADSVVKVDLKLAQHPSTA